MVSKNVKCLPGLSCFSAFALQMMCFSRVLEMINHHIYKLYPRCFGLLLRVKFVKTCLTFGMVMNLQKKVILEGLWSLCRLCSLPRELVIFHCCVLSMISPLERCGKVRPVNRTRKEKTKYFLLPINHN